MDSLTDVGWPLMDPISSWEEMQHGADDSQRLKAADAPALLGRETKGPLH